MKRFRKPKLKDGELRIYYGKLPHENPDVVYAWQGERSMKRDSGLLCCAIGMRYPKITYGKADFGNMQPSLIEELEARGYDITTIKFSIMKKANPTPSTAQE